jgi:hypothetical protein
MRQGVLSLGMVRDGGQDGKPQGLKPHSLGQLERPKAEALGYPEATAKQRQKQIPAG